MSEEVLEEVRDVLSRPKIRKRNRQIDAERINAFVKRLVEKSSVVENVQRHFMYSRNPKDEKYLNLAVEAQATYLVSRDKDLLDLMTGYSDECKDFRRRFRLLKIIEPVEFLKMIVPEETSAPEE